MMAATSAGTQTVATSANGIVPPAVVTLRDFVGLEATTADRMPITSIGPANALGHIRQWRYLSAAALDLTPSETVELSKFNHV